MLQPVNSPVDVGKRTSYNNGNDEEEEEEEVEKVKWNSTETFDGLTVWEHHALPDEKQDHWIRAIQEWAAMANAVRKRFALI